MQVLHDSTHVLKWLISARDTNLGQAGVQLDVQVLAPVDLVNFTVNRKPYIIIVVSWGQIEALSVHFLLPNLSELDASRTANLAEAALAEKHYVVPVLEAGQLQLIVVISLHSRPQIRIVTARVVSISSLRRLEHPVGAIVPVILRDATSINRRDITAHQVVWVAR